MEIENTKFEGVYIITPKVFKDIRGSFFESFNHEKFALATGAAPVFIQDNISHSTRGTLRGASLPSSHHMPKQSLLV